MKHTYIPVGDRILVRQDDPLEKTKGGLFIPDHMQHPPTYATVLEVGCDVKIIKQGDRIAFTRYAPQQIELEGEVLGIMREADASLIIRENQ